MPQSAVIFSFFALHRTQCIASIIVLLFGQHIIHQCAIDSHVGGPFKLIIKTIQSCHPNCVISRDGRGAPTPESMRLHLFDLWRFLDCYLDNFNNQLHTMLRTSLICLASNLNMFVILCLVQAQRFLLFS